VKNVNLQLPDFSLWSLIDLSYAVNLRFCCKIQFYTIFQFPAYEVSKMIMPEMQNHHHQLRPRNTGKMYQRKEQNYGAKMGKGFTCWSKKRYEPSQLTKILSCIT